jgi:hypothetical protein
MNGAPGYGKDGATLHSDSLEGWSDFNGWVGFVKRFVGRLYPTLSDETAKGPRAFGARLGKAVRALRECPLMR